ncbi:cysteine hydrolase family protein [Alicyclobacillus pomorum]|uniref:cysteine hydrolase family protein n=1 Tax=Alicyclobacillus pomorum TaxID=204470 RepID=UPI000408C172|nr:cysteine hydrolase family protein [Alicyclobacillus pomorum]
MKKALMVLDVQEDFLRNILDYIAPLCQRYVDEHATEYDAIVLTRWVYEEINGKDTLVVRHPSAVVVQKSTYSGYTEDTKRLLEEKNIDEVHLAGVDAEGAVLATMFSLVDSGYQVKILERLVTSYHGRNWEAMMIARHVLGKENVLNIGGGRVYI